MDETSEREYWEGQLAARGWRLIAGASDAPEDDLEDETPDEVEDEQGDETSWLEDLDAEVPDVPEGDSIPRSVAEQWKNEAARRRVEAKAFRELGSPEEIRARLQGAGLSPQEHLEALYRAGRALGFGDRELTQFAFGEVEDEPRGRRRPRDEDVDDDEDYDDEPLTPKQIRALLREELQAVGQQQQQAYTQQRQVESRNAAIAQAIDAELDALGVVGNKRMTDTVLNTAREILPVGVFDPVRVRQSIRDAAAILQKEVGVVFPGQNGNGNGSKAREKARQAARVPRTPSGRTPGLNGDAWEPDENDPLGSARRAAREQLRAQGIYND